MKKFDPKDLGLDKDFTDDTPIRAQLDIEQLLFRQIERCNLAATQDETLFAANVRILLNMIPANKREEVVARYDEYTSTQTKYEYKYNCGVPMGTPENPVNGSPYEVTEEVYDWHMLHQIIMEALEISNLTWKRESWTVDAQRAGDVEVIPQPQPRLIEAPTQLPQPLSEQMEPVKKVKRPKCPICGDFIGHKQGVHFKKRLICIKCMDTAKAKWID